MSKVYLSKIEDIVIIEPKVIRDSRGYFLESFRNSMLEDIGTQATFVQENQVKSYKGALRGLHYQLQKPQGKLVQVVSGAIMDVAVDIRVNSPDFGKSVIINLDSKLHNMVFIPEGFAHGYLVIEQDTIVQYKCTNYYDPNSEFGIIWNDKDLSIDWGVPNPVVSEKDSKLPKLKDQFNLPSIL